MGTYFRKSNLVVALMAMTLLIPAIGLTQPGQALAGPEGDGSWIVKRWDLDYASTGVQATVWLRQRPDGAMYTKAVVTDTRADGSCAHVQMVWNHTDGKTYYDWGMWVCGAGNSATFVKGARNPQAYYSVGPDTYLDNGIIKAHGTRIGI